jgi:hypothetical protein
MVIRAQIGNSPHVGIFILRVGPLLGLFIFFSDVVDALLVLLPIGVNHRRSVMSTGVALPLHVALLFAIAAHNIGVAWAVAAHQSRSGSVCLGRVGVAERLFTMDSRNLVNFLIGQFVPKDGVSFMRLHGGFDSRNLLGAFTIILNGLNFPGKLHALLECGLAGFQDLVADGVLDAGQKQLMLKK